MLRGLILVNYLLTLLCNMNNKITHLRLNLTNLDEQRKLVILYVIRFTAIHCVKLGTKAKQTIYYCSTSESLSLSLEEQCLIKTGSISLTTM